MTERCQKSLLGAERYMPIPEILQGRLRLPVIGAPMFIVSTPRLVLEQCKAGIVGSFPALNARPAAQLDDWLGQITEELAAYAQANPGLKVAPFAVNQIVHSSNDRLERDVAACVKHRVPIIITSLRPPAEVVAAVHGYGGGGVSDVLAAQALGADLAYLGTRFIATEEGNAAADYKQMLVDSSGEDIVYTSLFSGVLGNYLRGSVVRAGLDPDKLPEADKTKMNFGTGGN